jgi:hypothetical protein
MGFAVVLTHRLHEPDAWVDVPPRFNPQNLSGSIIDLESEEG